MRANIKPPVTVGMAALGKLETWNKIWQARRTKPLRQYLSDTGVLESEDEELIRAVKGAYWRNYHKQYKREKRSREQEYSIAWTKARRMSWSRRRKAQGKPYPVHQIVRMGIRAQSYLQPDRSEIAE